MKMKMLAPCRFLSLPLHVCNIIAPLSLSYLQSSLSSSNPEIMGLQAQPHIWRM